MSKVLVLILGGLGNQLFCYAAARRLTLMNNVELLIDDFSGFCFDTEYQRHYQLDHFMIPCRKATPVERLEPFSRIRRKFLEHWNRRLPFEQRSYLMQEHIDFDPRLLTLTPKNNLYLQGYWQSERYFKDVESQIRQDLRIREPVDEANRAMFVQIEAETAVAVHIRFFDEPEQSSNFQPAINNAPFDYYQRAVNEIEQRVPGAHYFLFSDRPDAARARIPLSDERITLVHHNQGDAMAYADLWLMTQCQHFIIANSTFSWWAAWLSDNPQKVVIAPGFEKRHGSAWWGFSGLIPDEWIKL